MLTLNKEHFHVLLETFQEESIELCLVSKERFEKFNEHLVHTVYSIKNNLPVNKKKTVSLRGHFDQGLYEHIKNKMSFKDSRNSLNLFNKIVGEKIKYSTYERTNIIKNIVKKT